jgi:hypothetical protein
MKLLTKLKLIFLILIGGETMVTVYVTLIIRGYKTFSQVPELLKDSVKEELEALELGHLAQ